MKRRRLSNSLDYYIGSAEGHEYPNLQVGDEVNPRPFFGGKSAVKWQILSIRWKCNC